MANHPVTHNKLKKPKISFMKYFAKFFAGSKSYAEETTIDLNQKTKINLDKKSTKVKGKNSIDLAEKSTFDLPSLV